MISVFDLEKLRGILKDFYEISHIRITVFDENRNELVSYPTAVASYCAVIRGSIKGLDACLDCDRRACETAAKKHSTHVYRCHAGHVAETGESKAGVNRLLQ
jgi:ligand-binding sensor protein